MSKKNRKKRNPIPEGGFKLSLKLKSVPVDLEGFGKCELREMDGINRDAYLNEMRRVLKTNANGETVGVANFDGLHSMLLKRCLFAANGEPIAEDEIKKFPASVQQTLFDAAQDLSGLVPDAEDDAETF